MYERYLIICTMSWFIHHAYTLNNVYECKSNLYHIIGIFRNTFKKKIMTNKFYQKNNIYNIMKLSNFRYIFGIRIIQNIHFKSDIYLLSS